MATFFAGLSRLGVGELLKGADGEGESRMMPLVKQAWRGVKLLTHDPWEFRRTVARRVRRRFRLGYRFRASGMAGGPYHVTLRLTIRCNLHCRMCFLNGELEGGRPVAARYNEPEDMSLAEWESAIDSIAPRKPVIGISGGEPTLYRYCYEIIRHAKDKGLYCGMTTNGTLLRDKAEELVASGLDSLWISLDGVGEIHDEIRRVPGTFRKAVDGILAVQEAKKKADSRRPEIGVNFIFVGDNHRCLEEMIATAIQIGAAEIHFSHLFFWTEEMTRVHEALFGKEIPCAPAGTAGLDRLDPRELHAALERIARRSYPIRIRVLPKMSLEETVTYYETPTRFVKSDRCLRPWGGMFVHPNGNVLPCLNYVTGNVKEQPLLDIWNSERFRRFRRMLRDHKAFPGCMRCCGLFDDSI